MIVWRVRPRRRQGFELFMRACSKFVLVAYLFAVAPAYGDDASPDLLDMSLEELVQIKLSSLSRRDERLFGSAAAAYVVSADDIRRSGATNIADVLRYVPGLHVANADPNKWAVTARGFTSTFANKLLVMIDGRTVYSPLFAGTLWDEQDDLLENIDRIEVLRGPQAALWGANAVNGVINIITKDSHDTAGGLVSATGGSTDRLITGMRYGGALGNKGSYRVFGKFFDRDGARLDGTDRQAGDWSAGRGGFRIDSTLSPDDDVVITGNGYRGRSGGVIERSLRRDSDITVIDDATQDLSGYNLLGRWTHSFSPTQRLRIQSYFDHRERSSRALGFGDTLDIADLDIQHDFNLGQRHALAWGVGYRFVGLEHSRGAQTGGLAAEFGGLGPLQLSIDKAESHLYMMFFRDEIAVIPQTLDLVLGARFESNSFTGFELQPTARLRWNADSRHSVWLAASRAVRTPSFFDNSAEVLDGVAEPGTPTQPASLEVLRGNPKFRSEEVISYEMGYWGQFGRSLKLSLSTFYNVYDHLSTEEPEPCRVPPDQGANPSFLECVERLANGSQGETYGVEAWGEWQPVKQWRLRLAYTHFQMHLRLRPGSLDDDIDEDEIRDPRHQVFAQAFWDLSDKLEFDLGIRYVDRLLATQVSDYVTVDARLAWRPIDRVELTLVGRNLVRDRQQEFGGGDLLEYSPVPIERSIIGTVRWKF